MLFDAEIHPMTKLNSKEKRKKRKQLSNDLLANKARFFEEIQSDSGGWRFLRKARP